MTVSAFDVKPRTLSPAPGALATLSAVGSSEITDGSIVSGDISGSAGITYAQLQAVSATARILGRKTSGAGPVEELSAADIKTILSLAATDISGLTVFASLAAGTAAQYVRGDGALATTPTALPPSGAAGGALTGSYPSPTLADPIDVTVRSTDPSTPASGHLYLYVKQVAGRSLPKFIGPSGLDSALQPFLARNKVGYWCPPGNASTAPGVVGYTALTWSGTPTARTVATTNMFTRMCRLGYVSATPAGALCGVRQAVAQYTLGTGTLGGFYKVTRFGISDAVVPPDARMFVGMTAATGAPTNVEPSTLIDCVGVGNGAADTNLQMFYGGSAAQPPIDLGSDFPSNTTNTDVYELALFAPPGTPATVYYEVTRLNTGHVATGTITGTSGTQVPAATTLLSGMNAWRWNNHTAVAVGLDIMSDYIETDQ